MDITFDFSDVKPFLARGVGEVKAVEDRVGQEGVAYAVAHGSYQDRTRTLRRSNEYHVDDGGLTLFNGATSPEGTQYASLVESRGYEVLSGAALHAERRMREEVL